MDAIKEALQAQRVRWTGTLPTAFDPDWHDSVTKWYEVVGGPHDGHKVTRVIKDDFDQVTCSCGFQLEQDCATEAQ